MRLAAAAMPTSASGRNFFMMSAFRGVREGGGSSLAREPVEGRGEGVVELAVRLDDARVGVARRRGRGLEVVGVRREERRETVGELQCGNDRAVRGTGSRV